MNIALYQLSHEVIHSLAPKVGGNAKVIEEGVAVWFSVYFVQKECKVDASSWGSEDYNRAYAAVKKLLDKDKDAILKLRKIEPSFDKMTRETFVKAKLNVSDRDISFLLMSHNALNKMIEKERQVKKTHALLAGIRALVGESRIRFISGRPRKRPWEDERQMMLKWF